VPRFSLPILIGAILFSSVASTSFAFSSKIAGYQSDFFGENSSSLNDNTIGYGAECLFFVENDWIGIGTGLSISSITGTETLMDGSTERLLNIAGTTYSAMISLVANILPAKQSRMRPYLSTGLELGIIDMKLPTNVSYERLASSEIKPYYGYYLGSGLLFVVGDPSKQNAVFIEFRYKIAQASLLGKSLFELNQLQLLLGFSI
jgi:hypothetical protein